MKTLKEQVEEIKSMNASKASKSAKLIKLGLDKYEVQLLLADEPVARTERHIFTFGVEIECLCARQSVVECCTRNNMAFQYEGIYFYNGV